MHNVSDPPLFFFLLREDSDDTAKCLEGRMHFGIIAFLDSVILLDLYLNYLSILSFKNK